MIALYRLVTRLVYLLLYPFGRRRARRGDLLWQGRLGLDLPDRTADIWLHAASVGEVRVLGNLVAFLAKSRPDVAIHVTTMTRAGYDTARDILHRQASISLFPLDAAPPIRRTLDRLRPRMIVVAETEIWPNLIRLAGDRRIPIVLVNGRMTESSFSKYRLVAPVMRKLLGSYDRFFFKSEPDQVRYAYFGVTSQSAEVAGDMKFDMPLVTKSEADLRELRSFLGAGDDRFGFLAGSTREGEEAMLLDVFCRLRGSHPRLRLCLAPRHLDRLDQVAALLESHHLPYRRFGENKGDVSVTLVDRMGILTDLYSAADLAFVGGTLVDIGGHNILEPVWAGTPVLFGPYLSNVMEAADYIASHNFGARVDSVDELESVVDEVISGQRQFVLQDETDAEHSATATVGNYILGRLSDV